MRMELKKMFKQHVLNLYKKAFQNSDERIIFGQWFF